MTDLARVREYVRTHGEPSPPERGYPPGTLLVELDLADLAAAHLLAPLRAAGAVGGDVVAVTLGLLPNGRLVAASVCGLTWGS